MKRSLFWLILAAAALLGVFYYAVNSSEPEVWENSAFVERFIDGYIY